MSRFPVLALALVCGIVVHVVEENGDYTPLTLIEVGALPDDEYAQVFGVDRHGRLVLRDDELDEGDDGWAGDLEPGIGGSAAGTGSAFD